MQDLFEGVLGADFMGEFAKPDAEAFQKVCCTNHLPHSGHQHTNCKHAQTCLLSVLHTGLVATQHMVFCSMSHGAVAWLVGTCIVPALVMKLDQFVMMLPNDHRVVAISDIQSQNRFVHQHRSS